MGLDASDGSVIFAFLIIFLGMFGLFLFGGLAWHYIRAHRAAALVDALSRYEHARHWNEGAPVMRDIRVYSLEMELKETGENVPILAQPPHESSSNNRSVTPDIDPRNDILTVDMSTFGILKWTVIHFSSVFYRRLIGRWRRQRHSSPGAAPINSSSPPQIQSEDGGLHLPPNMRNVEVAVMIAMPSPPRQPRLRPSTSNGGQEQDSEPLGEYVLGMTRLPFHPVIMAA